MKSLKVLVGFAAIFSLSACQTDAPGLTGPPKTPPPAIQRLVTENSAAGLEINIDTRVDVLFIIDDSQSMKNHQENLSRNIHQFVKEFSKINNIDFHIGFTVSHDSKRYGTKVPAYCGPETTTPGRVNWEEPGSLRQLIDPATNQPKAGRRFVSREDTNFAEILQATLDPNRNGELLKAMIDTDPAKPGVCAYGPEEEELFSPLLGALEDPSRRLGPNKDFRREGAMFVAIIVSDAKDSTMKGDGTELRPEEVVMRLRKATGEAQASKKMFRVFSVAMKPGNTITKQCKPDPAFANRVTRADGAVQYVYQWNSVIEPDGSNLATLASLTQDGDRGSVDQVLSICESNYGSTLAKYGAQVKQDVLQDVTIELPSYPESFPKGDSRNLSMFIGDHELQQNVQWSYNQNKTTVTVYAEKIDWNAYPNQKVRVRYVAVDPTAKTTKPIYEP